MKFPLFNKVEDSDSHLFFECVYAAGVWVKMQDLCNLNGLNSLDESIDVLSKLPCKKNIWSIVRRLAIADIFYHIWFERNQRHF